MVYLGLPLKFVLLTKRRILHKEGGFVRGMITYRDGREFSSWVLGSQVRLKRERGVEYWVKVR